MYRYFSGPTVVLISWSSKAWMRLLNAHVPYRRYFSGSILKVPKREIFDRSDFPDFYTMKSLRVGDFGVKIKKTFKNI